MKYPLVSFHSEHRGDSDSVQSHGCRVNTALLLAAGVGVRLRPLTADVPKCMIEVGGTTILGRLMRSLARHGFKRLVVVLGHLDQRIRDYLTKNSEGLAIQFVHNPRYATTNNVYSLWLARHLIQGPFLLLESDVVFDPDLISDLLVPDRIAVAKRLRGMSGTTVLLDEVGKVTAFSFGEADQPDPAALKTVNFYSLSQATWKQVVSRLGRHVAAGQVHDYYEVVFAELVAEHKIRFDGVSFDEGRWIEIDSNQDLRAAEILFRDHDRFRKDRESALPMGDR